MTSRPPVITREEERQMLHAVEKMLAGAVARWGSVDAAADNLMELMAAESESLKAQRAAHKKGCKR
jgi:hypothetical protein